MDIITEIKRMAKEKNALIVAHNYQNDEIQDIADYTGDSLELSQISARSNADIIVFCGVHFMAESASILSPDKKIILPDPSAGCPMADMALPEDLIEMKANHPGAKVVTYINSTAAIKALTDVCCTSSNALKIVENVDCDKIIFVPDRNLGAYIKRFTKKDIILWRGFCPTHEKLTKEDIIKIKSEYPDAALMVHPECRPEVIDMADEVCSTSGMIKFVRSTDHKRIIVGTEKGIIHKFKTVAPEKEYILASEKLICPNMKKINLEKLYNALRYEEPVVTVDKATSKMAYNSLRKMLELS